MLWEYLRSEQFRDAVAQSKGVCAVPIGCLEKHGPHSPLGTDTIHAAEITRLAAEKEPLVVFPTMYFGEKSGAGEFPGTVIFSVETRWHIFRETCNEIYRNGFKKILFCNGHGGNSSMLNLFGRAMMQENPNVMVFSTGDGGWRRGSMLPEIIADREKFGYLTDEDRAGLQDFLDQKKVTGHACFIETAEMLHLRPETLRMEGVREESGDCVHRFDEFSKFGIESPMIWMGNYPNSYHGSNDYMLNERIARAVVEWQVDGLAEKFHFLKNEQVSDQYHAEWLAKQ